MFTNRRNGRYLAGWLKRPCTTPTLSAMDSLGLAALYADILAREPDSAITAVLKESVSRATWRSRIKILASFLDTGGDQHPVQALNSHLEARMKSVQLSTVVKDLTHARWAFIRILPQQSISQIEALISDLQRGLRRMAAKRTTAKAMPMTLMALRRFLVGQQPAIKALAILTFRTASRVGEVLELTAANVNMKGPDLMVSFQVSKTNQEGDRRADHRIMVTDPEPALLAYVLPIAKGLLWTSAHKRQLRYALRNFKPEPGEHARWQREAPEDRIRKTYGFHSLKRGAAVLAWQALDEGRITQQDLQLLLKHKDLKSSLRYCPIPETAARSVGSKATHVTRIALSNTL
jgi:hypothetical protein